VKNAPDQMITLSDAIGNLVQKPHINSVMILFRLCYIIVMPGTVVCQSLFLTSDGETHVSMGFHGYHSCHSVLE